MGAEHLPVALGGVLPQSDSTRLRSDGRGVGPGREEWGMVRRPRSRFLVCLVAPAALMFGLVGCSSGSDGVETVVDAPTVVDSGATTGEGPIALAASSSEAALAARRAEAGKTLKSLTVEFTAPDSVAGKVKREGKGAFCSGPGTVVDGESFEVSYAAVGDAKVTSFSLVTQGSYEGPGSYAADLSWTDGTGPQNLLATVYVYDDEMSGEFVHEGSPALSGTWECRFEG